MTVQAKVCTVLLRREKMKKAAFIVPYVLSLALAVGIIPLGMFLFTLPLWVGAVCSLLPAAIVILFAVLRKPKGHVVSLELIGALLLGGLCFIGAFCNPYWGSATYIDKPYSSDSNAVITYEQAQSDMNTLMNTLKRIHPKFISETPAEVTAAYENELKKLSEIPEITVMDLLISMEKTVSPLRDAHTNVFSSRDYENDVFRYDYAEKVKGGWEITKVNGVDYTDFFDSISDRYSFEFPEWAEKDVIYALNNDFGLDYLELDGDGLTLEFTRGDEIQTITYSDADFLPFDEYMELNAEYYADRAEEKPFVYYEIDEENSLAVLTLESCTYNDVYKDTLREMFSKIKDMNIRNVAVDLRSNGGGNSLVVNEFIRYLDVDSYKTDSYSWRLGFLMPYFNGGEVNDRVSELTFTGNVYLLTSNDSFSSAMLFAEYIKDNSFGTLIGEIPGNAAYSYGDVTMWRMPESGLYLSCSTKQFIRVDADNPELEVVPDIPCEASQAYDVLLETIK